MRYSVFAGGKRLRPILTLAATEAVGGNAEMVLPAAGALEYIHTYSMIHDDLPAMDDDDYRRGKLTNHKVYGEAMAILAGDALLTHAFEVLSSPPLTERFPAALLQQVSYRVARASGSFGMIGGQVMDIVSEGQQVPLEILEYIHRHKTAALITAAVTMGGLLGGGTPEQVQALELMGTTWAGRFKLPTTCSTWKVTRRPSANRSGVMPSWPKSPIRRSSGLRPPASAPRTSCSRALRPWPILVSAPNVCGKSPSYIVSRDV